MQKLLLSKAPLLGEYFALDVSPEGEITALPELVWNYTPPLRRLPAFLLRLANKVDWESEKGHGTQARART